jgi:alkylation response protein AidB-like acyl-CoA dehydrogenase
MQGKIAGAPRLRVFYESTLTTADMYTTINSTRCYLYAVGRACDAGHVSNRDCAGAILHASDAALAVPLEAMQMLGGNGYVNEVRRCGRCGSLFGANLHTDAVSDWAIRSRCPALQSRRGNTRDPPAYRAFDL